jgi:glycosyltransferase involved in cell wall biosynthesis
LRKAGLDFHNARWRLTVSQHVRNELDALRAKQPIDAVVVNTQSVALQLTDLVKELPVCVCLDATFRQLASSRWFAPNAPTRWLLPLTLAPLTSSERALFHAATKLFPWSDGVANSLQRDYQEPAEKITALPPSLELTQLPFKPRTTLGGKPRLLFIGGDFQRKGGPLLLEVFRQYFAQRAELHIVTQATLAAEPGVTVHHAVKAYSPEWLALWQQADAFVFPSTLETFGLVLVEAMAMGVPVITATVGAAAELMGADERGLLLQDNHAATLQQALENLLNDYPAAVKRAAAGRVWVEQRHNLERNAGALGQTLQQLVR